jgi:hypothetical protein
VLRRLGLPITICLLMFAHVVSAQTETPTAETFPTFPLELKCIGSPTLPPKGWTYPGMILMSGYAGIHAMQADWSTPRVVAQFNRDRRGNIPLIGGQLSPDENWYAQPMGEAYEDPPTFHFVSIRKIRIYSLAGDSRILERDPSDQDQYIAFGMAFTYYPIQWRDNHSLMIAGSLLYPFAGGAEANPFQFSTLGTPIVFSPDLSRVYIGVNSSFDLKGSGYKGILDPSDPEAFNRPLNSLNAVYWRPNSSGFMAYTATDSEHSLNYFNRNGDLMGRVLDLGASSPIILPPIGGRTDLQWSPDNHYFVFSVFNSYPPPNKLYLIDWQKQVVIDTCLSPDSVAAWSPDGTMFAYSAKAREGLNVVVVDMKTWQAYIVARHSGYSPYLGEYNYPEMIGWRSTTQAQ